MEEMDKWSSDQAKEGTEKDRHGGILPNEVTPEHQSNQPCNIQAIPMLFSPSHPNLLDSLVNPEILPLPRSLLS